MRREMLAALPFPHLQSTSAPGVVVTSQRQRHDFGHTPNGNATAMEATSSERTRRPQNQSSSRHLNGVRKNATRIREVSLTRGRRGLKYSFLKVNIKQEQLIIK